MDNSNNSNIEEKRNKYGIRCGLVGIFLNLLLFAGKFFAGWLSHSISITSDAFNNLSDAGASIVTLVGFKISGAAADEEHPFGHGRMEYVSAFVVASLIIVVGFELLKDSVSKIIHPEDIEYSAVILGILIASIAVKAVMFAYNMYFGKMLDSAVLKATATDSISDVVVTTVVLISTLVCHFTGLKIDGYCGTVVAIVILYAGYNAGKDALDPLLGQPPEKEFLDKIEELALSFDENICGVHDLMVHDYGPGRLFISLHAEVPADGDILKLHDIIDNLERRLAVETRGMVTIHMDPIATNDPAVKELKEKVVKIVSTIYDDINVHDFRIVEGDTHTNLIFDVVVPFSYKSPEEELKRQIDSKVKAELGQEYYTVVDVDRIAYK